MYTVYILAPPSLPPQQLMMSFLLISWQPTLLTEQLHVFYATITMHLHRHHCLCRHPLRCHLCPLAQTMSSPRTFNTLPPPPFEPGWTLDTAKSATSTTMMKCFTIAGFATIKRNINILLRMYDAWNLNACHIVVYICKTVHILKLILRNLWKHLYRRERFLILRKGLSKKFYYSAYAASKNKDRLLHCGVEYLFPGWSRPKMSFTNLFQEKKLNCM